MNEEHFEEYERIIKHLELNYHVGNSEMVFDLDEEEQILSMTCHVANIDTGQDYQKTYNFDVAKKVGRPSIGSTKRVALTLPDEIWEEVEQYKKKWDFGMAQTIRRMIEEFLLERDEETSHLKCPHCTSYHTYLLNEEVISNKDRTVIKASYTCNRCNNIFYADHWNNEVKIYKKSEG